MAGSSITTSRPRRSSVCASRTPASYRLIDLSEVFVLCDLDGSPLAADDRPLMIALTKQMSAHRRIRFLRADKEWREIAVTAIPDHRGGQPPPGRHGDDVGGRRVRLTLQGTRGSMGTGGPRDDGVRRRHLVRQSGQ